MCVEVNAIYSLVEFVLIFLCDIFLALISCVDGECVEHVASEQEGIFYVLGTFGPCC